MNTSNASQERHNLSILTGQGTLSTIAWTMANPSIVLTYIAISLDLPVLLAGLLVTFSQAARLFTATFGTPVAERRIQKKRDLAITDMALAFSFIVALTAAAFGTQTIVAISFILCILIVGAASEYQAIITAGFYGNVLNSNSRNILMYSVMTLGGILASGLAWWAHRAFFHDPPFERHVVLVSIGVVCFVVASIVILLVREYTIRSEQEDHHGHQPHQRRSFIAIVETQLRDVYDKFSLLLTMEWFRSYLRIRLALLTVELSVPFYAILAALSHHESPKGLAALIISSATALIVSGPLWGAIGTKSTRLVMVLGAMMAASAGLLLIVDHFIQLASAPYIHAVALFLVTIAVRGVTTARYLYFIDIAPEKYVVTGIGVSKVAVRIVGIGLSFVLASVAHIQHVLWAILALALINGVTAILAMRAPEAPRNGETANA
ncbi:MFS transporter [Hoeflea prorocentri]|uniref:MFS transporter n=1 Tax=Hoeflea prorocentri TaxID=1922333 RepID=A0A9X3UL11_9HYPH|nr:MFS transporter [Hoeflea prorocentri]MCY6381139.1 hypothetical protein [Hoeflea prorocentri]MDA5398939.1 hypothetical protein [Hoeflea prorocentri]